MYLHEVQRTLFLKCTQKSILSGLWCAVFATKIWSGITRSKLEWPTMSQLRHKWNCDCVSCEWIRHHDKKKEEKKRKVARKVRKKLGIQYRRETLGRLIEEGLNSFYYSDRAKEFLSVNENLLEWLHIQINNAHDAQERWRKERKRQ